WLRWEVSGRGRPPPPPLLWGERGPGDGGCVWSRGGRGLPLPRLTLSGWRVKAEAAGRLFPLRLGRREAVLRRPSRESAGGFARPRRAPATPRGRVGELSPDPRPRKGRGADRGRAAAPPGGGEEVEGEKGRFALNLRKEYSYAQPTLCFPY
ncbi:Hypothetical predicted protein, partial [Podarcis lilfordi]